MTKAAVARALGVSPATLYNWLRGDHPIDVETLAMSLAVWPSFLRCLVTLERKGRVI
jgi:transcriptional regulator with XRE-family HTH domain